MSGYNGLSTITVERRYRVDGVSTKRKVKLKAFVLKDGPAALIYIPLKSLTQIDYKRLKDIEKKGGEMLTAMRDTKLGNGRNALSLYQNLIEVHHKEEKKEVVTTSEEEEQEALETPQKPAPKRRGRKPKAKTA